MRCPDCKMPMAELINQYQVTVWKCQNCGIEIEEDEEMNDE